MIRPLIRSHFQTFVPIPTKNRIVTPLTQNFCQPNHQHNQTASPRIIQHCTANIYLDTAPLGMKMLMTTAATNPQPPLPLSCDPPSSPFLASLFRTDAVVDATALPIPIFFSVSAAATGTCNGTERVLTICALCVGVNTFNFVFGDFQWTRKLLIG